MSESVLASDGTVSTFEVAEGLLENRPLVRRLVGYAWSRFRLPREDAEDLIQETLLALCQQQAQVAFPDGFVFQVFHRACIRRARLNRVDVRREIPLPDMGDREPAHLPPDAGIRIDIRRAYTSLAATCRMILSAYYVEGRTMKEAADYASIASSGAMKTINRCLKRLKQCLLT